jgi:hypothetical protein
MAGARISVGFIFIINYIVEKAIAKQARKDGDFPFL